ncbi:MAG: hypothetical protein K2N11_05695 [Mucispirillum sp.]|nr:hypothetical protein [Mucispirillum sp.]
MQLCAECRRIIKLLFLFAIIFYVTSKGYNIPAAFFMMLASVALFASLGFWAAVIEVFTIFLPVLILHFITDNIFAVYLIPLTNILLIMSYRAGRLPAAFISYAYIIFWSYLTYISYNSFIDYAVILVCFLNILLHIKGLFIKAEESLKWSFIIENNDETADKVLSSLKEGLYDIKGEITALDNIEKAENNIVIYAYAKFASLNMAFMYKLYKYLPKGKNNKAYIIYKAPFFPEMAYIPLWLMLYIKGYKVMGRAYYIEGIVEIKTANIYFAAQKEMLQVISKGMYDISDGFTSALPLYIHLSPFALISTVYHYIKYIFNKVKNV